MNMCARNPLSWILAAITCAGCAPHRERDGEVVRVANTRGSAVVLTRDERIAVATHRSAGVVSVCPVDTARETDEMIGACKELDLGQGSEPWAAVIGADDDTAYVISRRDQLVYRISGLHAEPQTTGSVRVGSEPTAIVITPSGRRLFVANWAEGTISVITTDDFVAARDKLDLNQALGASGLLGEIVARRALAHPRALALTDDGDADDGDETLYATEFFSQPLDADAAAALDPEDVTQFDRNRQGLVYPIALSERGSVGAPVRIAPILDTGFYDGPNSRLPAEQRVPTSCFPNQLYAAAVVGTRLFVTSMCASPAGPVGGGPENSKTLMHPTVFVIDTVSNRELPEQAAVLTQTLERRYAQDESATMRMPLIPNDIALELSPAEERVEGCLTAMGANAAFCFSYDGGGLVDIGSEGRRHIDLELGEPDPGRLPIGVALLRGQGRRLALVVNDGTQVLTLLDRGAGRVWTSRRSISAIERAVELRTSSLARGREAFMTGLKGWSFEGQAWASCEGCHPDGLSDGVTWFFPRGPRHTISTVGTYAENGQQRIMLWTANIDEVHDIEAIVRTVAGGAGNLLWQYQQFPDFRILYDGSEPVTGSAAVPKPSSALRNNLNGSLAALLEGEPCSIDAPQCDVSAGKDWNDIDLYIQALRTPRPPSDLDPTEVAHGREVFEHGRCSVCHAGPSWTLSRRFYTPAESSNGRLPYHKPASPAPDMLGWLRTETYEIADPVLAQLNPPAFGNYDANSGSYKATLRRWVPEGRSDVENAYHAETHLSDQINCVLRDVGTFPTQSRNGVNTHGISAAGGPRVREVRQDMEKLAEGKTGFNIPSLLGLATRASYFHAGNARTLEDVFDAAFDQHSRVVPVEAAPAVEVSVSDGSFGRPSRVRALVAFLLSLDDTTPFPDPVPSTDFCE